MNQIGKNKLNDLEKVNNLIKKGLDAKAKEHWLMYALRNNNVEIIKLLAESGLDLSTQNNAPLMISSENGDIEIIKYLISKNVDVSVRESLALIYASYDGNLDVMKCLVENGADINAQDGKALIELSYIGNLDAIKYMVAKGADIHLQKDLALLVSVKTGYLEMFKFLMDHGANINAQEKILNEVIFKNNIEFVKLLILEYDFDVNIMIEKAKKAYKSEIVDWCEKYIESKNLSDKLESDLNKQEKIEKRNKI